MDPIQTLIEDMGYECRSYSGRGMNGKECIGVVVQSEGAFIAALIERVASGDYAEHAEYISDAFSEMRSDSMGRDVILYFPGYPYTSEEED